MGSDRKAKRKNSDKPIIRLPFSSTISGSNKGLPEIVSEKCPTSFQEKLEESPYLRDGIKISLKKRGEIYLIVIQETEIGTLSKKRSLSISNCLELGIRYSGKIIFTQGQYFARFFRETN